MCKIPRKITIFVCLAPRCEIMFCDLRVVFSDFLDLLDLPLVHSSLELDFYSLLGDFTFHHCLFLCSYEVRL